MMFHSPGHMAESQSYFFLISGATDDGGGNGHTHMYNLI